MPAVESVGSVASVAEFTVAVRPYLGAVARVAHRFAPAGEGDDVAQEALLAAWRYRGRFDPDRAGFGTWLLAIVVTESSRASRGRKRRQQLLVHLAGQATPSGGEHQVSECGAAIEAAIARLSRRQRDVVGLYYFVDLPIGQVAEVLGLSEGAVKSTLAAARARIRQLVDVEEG